MKVYNNSNRTFGLRNLEGQIAFLIKPATFAEIPAEMEGDITLKTAIAAKELTPYESTKQADTIERAAEEEKVVRKARAKKEE